MHSIARQKFSIFDIFATRGVTSDPQKTIVTSGVEDIMLGVEPPTSPAVPTLLPDRSCTARLCSLLQCFVRRRYYANAVFVDYIRVMNKCKLC